MIAEYRSFLKNGGGKLPQQLIMAMVCEKMGWTLEQYLCQPLWFIKTLILKMNLDAEYTEELNRQHGSK